MASEQFATLRTLLDQEPSREQWKSILITLEQCPDETLDEALSLADERLSSWHDSWRTLAVHHKLFGDSPQAARDLKAFPLLRSLSISSDDPAYLIEHKEDCRHIRNLTANWTLTPPHLEWLIHLPHLTGFDLRTDGQESIGGLRHLPQLTSLNLFGYNEIDDYDILPSLPALKHLKLHDVGVYGLEGAHFSFPKLETLITTNGLEPLTWIDIDTLESLKEFELDMDELAFFLEEDEVGTPEEGALDEYWAIHWELASGVPELTFWVPIEESSLQQKWRRKAPPGVKVCFYKKGAFGQRIPLMTCPPK
ncbi:MAG: hypothetical protein CL920_22515 [Deltaproteobacteria bacterium]|nr:hypothetical protein [Deltaproteobacteria bacterium]MBU51473.1 hypothetical protein [Deltaproteobacteria bacterium]